MKHSKHYFRAALLIVGGLFVFLIARSLLIPPSFGEYGHYRGADIQEQMNRPLAFGPANSCAECHPEAAAVHQEGKHRSVPCQDCHAPLAVHIKDGVFQEMMPINRSAALCLRCHGALPSRPAGFPQIDVKEHLAKRGQTKSAGICLTCHQPHKPAPGAKHG